MRYKNASLQERLAERAISKSKKEKIGKKKKKVVNSLLFSVVLHALLPHCCALCRCATIQIASQRSAMLKFLLDTRVAGAAPCLRAAACTETLKAGELEQVGLETTARLGDARGAAGCWKAGQQQDAKERFGRQPLLLAARTLVAVTCPASVVFAGLAGSVGVTILGWRCPRTVETWP